MVGAIVNADKIARVIRRNDGSRNGRFRSKRILVHILNPCSAGNTDPYIRFNNSKPVHDSIVIHAQITAAVDRHILRIAAVPQEEIGQIAAIVFRSAQDQVIHGTGNNQPQAIQHLRGRQDAAFFNRDQPVFAEA